MTLVIPGFVPGPGAKVRLTEVEGTILTALLAGRLNIPGVEIESDLPEDAQVVGVEWDSIRQMAVLVVWSDTFDPVSGYVIPIWMPEMKAHYGRWVSIADLEQSTASIVGGTS